MPVRIQDLLQIIIELLAAIPSVVYGLWGIFVVIPLVRPPADWLHSHLGWIPFFGTTLSGPGMLPAAMVLAIMVLADDFRDLARRAGGGAAEDARGGFWNWRHAMGSDLGDFRADCRDRHLRRDHPGLRAGARRDDGARDAGGQRQCDQLVGIFAGQYARGVAGESFSRGGPGRGRRLDVCRACVAGDHAVRQCRRHCDPPARRFRELKGLR